MTDDPAVLRDISPGKHYCHTCKRVTNWYAVRGRVQRCDGCDERFPCQHDCTHLDCKAARKHKGT